MVPWEEYTDKQVVSLCFMAVLHEYLAAPLSITGTLVYKLVKARVSPA